MCIYSTFVISVVYALDELFELGFVSTVFSYIPLYSEGFGWVLVAGVMFAISIFLPIIFKKKQEVADNVEC